MDIDASKTCDVILSHIKSSNLNFSLTESPFSVHISIRKTFITDKNGNRITGIFQYSSEPISNDYDRKLVIENQNLKADIKYIEQEKSELEEAIHELSMKLEKSKVETIKLLEEKKETIVAKEIIEKQLKMKLIENTNLAAELLETKTSSEIDRDEMDYLQINNKNLKKATKRLNKELSKVKDRLKKELNDTVKELKTEIKHWRKELGRERTLKIKLENRLKIKKLEMAPKPKEPEPQAVSSVTDSCRASIPSSYHDENLNLDTNSTTYAFPFKSSRKKVFSENHAASEDISVDENNHDTCCSICAEPIIDYIPKYYHGLLINPACLNCDETDDNTPNLEEENLIEEFK